MPDVQEVFRMATQKVRPDPGALDRQLSQQRSRRVNRKVGAFVLVATMLVVAGVVALSAIGDTPDRPAVVPTPSAGVDTRLDLYLVDPDTGDADPILVEEGDQGNGDFSPDGTRIVFEGSDPERFGLTQIFVREPDGPTRQLTNLRSGAGAPTWSPDGSLIAFSGDEADLTDRRDIFVMNADGTGMRRLGGSRYADLDPEWSPDGKSIVFWNEGLGESIFVHPSHPDDDSEIWLVSVSDGSITRITRNRLFDGRPTWSPDGAWIAFTRAARRIYVDGTGPYDPGKDLWLMRPDGTQLHRLLDDQPDVERDQPTWSPDGREIAYVESTLMKVVVATGETTQIVTEVDPYDLDWGPTGILVSHAVPEACEPDSHTQC
jgi:Tol biopolymer transport system component